MSTEQARGAFMKPNREHLGMPTTTAAIKTGEKKNETRRKTVWEYYNDRAEIVDKELVRDWNDSLNTLLIFAALFSAILTAFIIESMKLLDEDTAQMSRDILLTISRQLNNNSLPPYPGSTTESFVPPAFAVRINSFFFVSISCSLIAALGAVLALQWVGSYDTGLNPSSAIDRALQRQLRYEGIEKWKMGEIISAFPALLYLALLMFMVGLVDWLWHMHRTVAAISITGLLVAVTLFTVTTIIGVFDVFSPFRTPVSQLAGYGSQWARYISRRILYLMRKARRTQSNASYTVPDSPPEAPVPFKEREKKQIQRVHRSAYRNSIQWFVNQTEDVPSARPQFLAVIDEFLRQSTDQLVVPELPRSLRATILENAIWPYKEGNSDTKLGDDDMSTLTKVVSASIDLGSSILSSYPAFTGFRSVASRPQKSLLGLFTNIFLLIEGYSNWYDVVKYANEIGVSIFALERRFILPLLRSIANQDGLQEMPNISILCRLLEPLDLRGMQKMHRTVVEDSEVLELLMDIADLIAKQPISIEHSTIWIVIALQYLFGSTYDMKKQAPRLIQLFEASPELAISQRQYLYASLLEEWSGFSSYHKYNILKLVSHTLDVQHRPGDSPTLWINVVAAADKVISSSLVKYDREALTTLVLRLCPGLAKPRTLSSFQAPRDRTLALLYSIYDEESSSGPWEELESVSGIAWKDPIWVQAVEVWFRNSRHLERGYIVQRTLKMMSQTLAHGPYRLFRGILVPLSKLIRQMPREMEAVATIICHPRMMACDVLAPINWTSYNPKISEILCRITRSPELPRRLKQAGVERYIMTLSKMGEFTSLYKLLSHCISEARDLTILHWYVTLAYIPLHVNTKIFSNADGWHLPYEFRLEGLTSMVQESHAAYGRWLPSASESDAALWQMIFAELKELECSAKRGYTAMMEPLGAGRVRDPDGLCARGFV